MKKKMYFDECYRQEAHDYVIESMMKTAERYHCQIEFHFIPHGETEINIDNGLYSKRYFLDWGKPVDLVEAISDIWTDFFAGPEDLRRNHCWVHKQLLTITNVIFNEPATIVFWSDGTKTVVKAQGEDEYDPEKGLAMAIAKKYMGNKGSYYNEFDKWLGKYYAKQEEANDILDGFLDDLRRVAEYVTEQVAELDRIVNAKKKPMTCREKLAKEYPSHINNAYVGGCAICPDSYAYAPRPEFCLYVTPYQNLTPKQMDTICRKCWDRPVEEK